MSTMCMEVVRNQENQKLKQKTENKIVLILVSGIF